MEISLNVIENVILYADRTNMRGIGKYEREFLKKRYKHNKRYSNFIFNVSSLLFIRRQI